MKILCMHGVGHKDAEDPNSPDAAWRNTWRDTVTRGLRQWNAAVQPQFHFPVYDPFFERAPLKAGTVMEALARLTTSGLFYGVVDVFRSRRGFGDMMDGVRWTAGMVAQWVALEDLRAQLRAALAREITAFQPDVILAHSLGSLILYDTIKQDEEHGGALSAGRSIVTLGSQIGNPAVRGEFGGRVEELRNAAWWWHLYNREDDVFTCAIEPPTRERFQQIDTEFDVEGIADHEATEYLAHDNTGLAVWQALGTGSRSARSRPFAMRVRPSVQSRALDKPQMRALLVGVADYPDPENCLAGPVNDVFMVSSVLQELGFPADNIRVVLNERATAAGIRERLHWLLDDAGDGDTLFLFFAGHGAQIPSYGSDAEVDRIDECLVPYDFDWRAGNAITDDEFCALYSQLPYKAQFTVALDCCHSGGMTRSGGARVRGLAPPDDIRHRSVRWDKDQQMWLPRKRLLEAGENRAANYLTSKRDRKAMIGESGAVQRIGRATSLWTDKRDFKRATGAFGHDGPYTPIVLEACDESEFAYEYRHGAISYGAFTYSLCESVRNVLRRNDERRKLRQELLAFTFEDLHKEVARRIKDVVAEPQTPQMVGPGVWRSKTVPGI
jgi:hypothetical protein